MPCIFASGAATYRTSTFVCVFIPLCKELARRTATKVVGILSHCETKSSSHESCVIIVSLDHLHLRTKTTRSTARRIVRMRRWRSDCWLRQLHQLVPEMQLIERGLHDTSPPFLSVILKRSYLRRNTVIRKHGCATCVDNYFSCLPLVYPCCACGSFTNFSISGSAILSTSFYQ